MIDFDPYKILGVRRNASSNRIKRDDGDNLFTTLIERRLDLLGAELKMQSQVLLVNQAAVKELEAYECSTQARQHTTFFQFHGTIAFGATSSTTA